MIAPKLTLRQWIGYLGLGMVFLVTASVAIWRGDILRAALDPHTPFQVYQPPEAPDYARREAWALSEARATGAGPAAVFFLHSTTYDGGREWNGPIGDERADAYLTRVVLPNYAGPFARAGAVSAPRYRQASLYTRMTLREDAREARAFAYGDASAAFEAWLERNPRGPLILAGVEQGGELIERLVRERVVPDPALRRRLVGVWLIDVVVARDGVSPLVPLCARRAQAGCIVSWTAVGERSDGAAERRLRRGLVWNSRGRLEELDGRVVACVNPVTGGTDQPRSEARASRGATNATGLEWGARPALMAREVAAECRGGLLRQTEPQLESFRETGSWADRRKARQYNLFYGDIEADVDARMAVWLASPV